MLPNHVAVIMDGNGRWAKSRMMPRVEGHRRGIESLRLLVKHARRIGIRHLTVFAFSSENWKRPEAEVRQLMAFFVMGLKREAEPLAQAGVRLHVVGDTETLPEELRAAILESEAITAQATAMTLNVCTNYGGRWDVANAARRVVQKGLPLTVENMDAEMSMPWAGPVDLMIRTGGEQRISNFILWQAAYAELYFSGTYWPDYAEKDFDEALAWFANRERRFGNAQ